VDFFYSGAEVFKPVKSEGLVLNPFVAHGGALLRRAEVFKPVKSEGLVLNPPAAAQEPESLKEFLDIQKYPSHLGRVLGTSSSFNFELKLIH